MISTGSEELPPVQLSVSPALRVTEAGKPPVMVSGEPRRQLDVAERPHVVAARAV